MSLAALRQDYNMTSHWAVCRHASEQRMLAAQHERDECIRTLQAGTTTLRSDDGVTVEIQAGTIEAVRQRVSLWQRQAELTEAEQRAWRGCLIAAWRNYNHSCRVQARLKAAALHHDELQQETLEHELHQQMSAAHDAAAKQSQRYRPLVVCRASNAPNGAVDTRTQLHSAADHTKEAAPT